LTIRRQRTRISIEWSRGTDTHLHRLPLPPMCRLRSPLG
jgi:hypothetical protein